MNQNNQDLILTLIKRYKIFILLYIVVFALGIYVLGFSGEPEFLKAPIPSIYNNQKDLKQLKIDVEAKKSDLNRILEEKKQKNEAAKKATVKDFYQISNIGDIVSDYTPMFDNIITMIRQNGLRMKSIKYTPNPTEDNLIKNGNGVYSGCRVDFVLVGYYPQFSTFLGDIENYPYFINVSKFEITPYQYDKRILIANVSIVFYSKRN